MRARREGSFVGMGKDGAAGRVAMAPADDARALGAPSGSVDNPEWYNAGAQTQRRGNERAGRGTPLPFS